MYLQYNLFFFEYYNYTKIMDFNIESRFLNKMIKNKFDILDIEENNEIYLYYLEKNLLYVKIVSKSKGWNGDIQLRIYSLDKSKFEDISIGGSYTSIKEMEFYMDIDLDYNVQINRKNIPNDVIFNKKFDINNKTDYYEFVKFQYANNFYLINNNLNPIIDFINTNYKDIKSNVEYIINDNIRLILYVLLYLNKNGGIFINFNLIDLSIDDYNIDENLCFINNNFISLIFTKINFLNESLLLSDLNNRKKLDFSKYLIDFTIKYDEPIIVNKINSLTYDYYTDIYPLNRYTFYLLSKKNIKYFVEELQGDYYCLSTNNDFEKDLILEIYDKEIDSRFLFNEQYVKNRFQNNCIFKL